MGAFLYGIFLQWKLDIRSKTLLITCYIVPLLFFAVMGEIFTEVMPDYKHTLIQSMTIFGVTMGALIGLPPSLVEIYASDIKKVYRANGVPVCLGFVLTNISAFIHLFITSVIIYFVAPILFDADIPNNPGLYFACLSVFIMVSLGIASVIGLSVKDQAKPSMLSIIFFLPLIMLFGIMFPTDLLPNVLRVVGKLFPASWGYILIESDMFDFMSFAPLLIIFIVSLFICVVLLKKVGK